MRTGRIVAFGFLMLLAMPAPAEPPPAECPQPRFTGKAPEPDYSQVNPLAKERAALKAGRKMYLGKDGHPGCSMCHGKSGAGNGPIATQFHPRPRNFACAQTVNGIPDGQLFWITRHGSPDTAMPAHPEYDDTQIWQLVLYLRELARD